MITFDYDKSYRKGRLICDDSILTFVRNHFSIKDKGVSFTNRTRKLKGQKPIPDRKYVVQQSGLFDFGLYEEILEFLISESITEIDYSEEFSKTLECGWGDIIIEDTLNFPLRDYQVECLEMCCKVGRGTVVSATGSGKSLIQASLIENWKLLKGSYKCLIIVPGTGLVHQLLKDFEEYGVTCEYSGWTGEKDTKGNYSMPLQNTDVIIVNSEMICSQFGDYKWLLDVDLVLVDECHKTKDGNRISKIIHKIKTPNKFGFTGTLPKEEIDRWKIIGTFGSIIYEKKSKELRDKNYLSDIVIRVLKLNHSVKVRGYKKEMAYIHEDDSRNNLIKKLVNKMPNNVLILVDRIAHGENIYESLQELDREVFFISGEMPVSERAIIIAKMEQQNDIACVAISSVFSTGINVKNLHYAIFAAGYGKSFIRVVQSIGRGLRLHESKNKFVLFDLYDNFKFSMEHIEDRKNFYDEEQIPWKETEIEIK